MRTVERLIATSLVEMREVDPEEPDAQRCLRAYFAELEPARARARVRSRRGLHGRAARGAAPHGAFVVAYLRGEPIGLRRRQAPPGRRDRHQAHVGGRVGARAGPGPAAARSTRGAGARAGSREARIETGDVLVEAIALYRSAGYAEVAPFNDEPFADRWFAKPL